MNGQSFCAGPVKSRAVEVDACWESALQLPFFDFVTDWTKNVDGHVFLVEISIAVTTGDAFVSETNPFHTSLSGRRNDWVVKSDFNIRPLALTLQLTLQVDVVEGDWIVVDGRTVCGLDEISRNAVDIHDETVLNFGFKTHKKQFI